MAPDTSALIVSIKKGLKLHHLMYLKSPSTLWRFRRVLPASPKPVHIDRELSCEFCVLGLMRLTLLGTAIERRAASNYGQAFVWRRRIFRCTMRWYNGYLDRLSGNSDDAFLTTLTRSSVCHYCTRMLDESHLIDGRWRYLGSKEA